MTGVSTAAALIVIVSVAVPVPLALVAVRATVKMAAVVGGARDDAGRRVQRQSVGQAAAAKDAVPLLAVMV